MRNDAHKNDSLLQHPFKTPTPEWRPPSNNGIHNTPFHTCSFCGSISPTDLLAALRGGATLSLADRKYGWPHKFYVEGIPNQFAGSAEVIESTSRAIDEPLSEEQIKMHGYGTPSVSEVITVRKLDGVVISTNTTKRLEYKKFRPSAPTSRGKFYTIHLQDATPEERLAIHQAIGLDIRFGEDGSIHWRAMTQHEGAK